MNRKDDENNIMDDERNESENFPFQAEISDPLQLPNVLNDI